MTPPTRVQLRATCFLGILGLHVPKTGEACGFPTISREAYDFLHESNMEMVARDFQRALKDALNAEAYNQDFMYKMITIPILTGAFTRSFFNGLWFTDRLHEQPTGLARQ